MGTTFYVSGFLFSLRHAYAPDQFNLILLGSFGGLFGSLVDSVLGALLQYSGFSESSKKIVNRAPRTIEEQKFIKHISGVDVLDNHQVNFLANTITSLTCAYLATKLF